MGRPQVQDQFGQETLIKVRMSTKCNGTFLNSTESLGEDYDDDQPRTVRLRICSRHGSCYSGRMQSYYHTDGRYL
jgi:hypothetical protein